MPRKSWSRLKHIRGSGDGRTLVLNKMIGVAKKGFPGSSEVKNLPAVQETKEMSVQSLGWEDPLEEGMATHSSIIAWRIPWTEEAGGLYSIGLPRVRYYRSD